MRSFSAATLIALTLLATAARGVDSPSDKTPLAPIPKASPKVSPVVPPPGVTQEPSIVGTVKEKYLIDLKAKGVPAGVAIRWQVYVKNKDGDFILAVGKVQPVVILAEKRLIFAGPVGDYFVQCSFQKGLEYIDLEWRGSITGDGIPPVPPGPGPVPPGPNPPGPGPVDPLKSFRIIFIYESSMNLTPEQRAVIYGVEVENWMVANCTGGRSGFRRRDKDSPGEADKTMAELWKSVQPAITVTPCVAMERNGKVEIVNLEATAAKMVEKFTTYRGK